MGIPILILGESGTGKSASMRNFSAGEIALANVAGKPLPFRLHGGGRFVETINTDSYRAIKKFMQESAAQTIVIDDAQYLMANEFMRRSSERGYDKFTEIAVNFWDLVNAVRELPESKIVVFMAHIDRDNNGNEKIKTIGKMLDEKITVEGMFTIVLKTSVSDGKYSFLTQNSGHDTVKSPIGLFPATEIDNDLKAVIGNVRAYYFGDGQTVKEEPPTTPPPMDEDAPPVVQTEEAKPETVEQLPQEQETPKRTRRTRRERPAPPPVQEAPRADEEQADNEELPF